MDEKYRLIFRGELLDGQHRAVVKRRLTELLKLNEDHAEKLFSGQPVVLKRDVDRETAARYQALFKKAGGRLRIKSEGPAEVSASPAVERAAVPAKQSAESPTTEPSAQAKHSGRPAAAVDIEAPDFKVQSTWFAPPEEPRPEIDAPNYSVAAVGSDLTEIKAAPAVAVAEVDFALAEVGADLLTERPEDAAVELGPLDFEVAEVGADISPEKTSPEVAAPDISHLALVEP